ncbi:MAG: sugar ABC transporter ATP-binding protein [Microbacterium sp.]
MTTTASATLAAHGVGKSFPGVRALDGVDLTFEPGRVHALLGENGAGKSTLVKILTGNQTADAGRIEMAGSVVRFGSPAEAMSHGVSAVYQELTVMPEMSVVDNVMLGHDVARRGVLQGSARRRRAREALDRVALTGVDLGSRAGDLSLANQQLIEIARAIARDSTVLILDEPSAVLSGDKLSALHDVVRAVAADGAAILYITHLLDEVAALTDDVTILRDGRLVSSGPASDYSERRIIQEMIGRSVESVFPDPAPPRESIVLDVQGVVPSQTAVPPTDLTVRSGEIVGIAGLVGSGRSRLLRTIAGVRGRAAGQVLVDGTRVRDSVRAAVTAGLAFVPEERKAEGLILDLTVSQNMTLAVLREISTMGWIRPERQRAAFAEEQGKLSIKASSPAQSARDLSGGNQQKIVIGKWLRARPSVLLLDEPTRGVDIGAKAEIYRIIHALAEEGLAIVLASSELNEVVGLAHRVIVCRSGRVVGEVERSEESPEKVMELMMGVTA